MKNIKVSQKREFTDIVLLHEKRGEPDGLTIAHFPLGPTLYFSLSNVVLRHDLPEKPDNMSEEYPHLIFHGFNTALGQRIINIIKHLFPIPKYDSKRIMTFANNNDIISFRHHVYQKEDYKTVNLKEVGPRFEMLPFQIILGTPTQPEAQKEWVLKPFLNTASKTKLL